MPDDRVLSASALIDAPPLGAQIDALWALREKKREAEAVVSEYEELIRSKEFQLQAAMEAQNATRAAGRKASASIQESVVPQVEDWDTYYAFIRRHNAFELLERRPAAGAWREHAERRRDKTVPGTVPFTKRKVSIRVIS